jgi:hypothetical protein
VENPDVDANQESGGAVGATPGGSGLTDPLPARSWWIPPFLLLFSFLLRIPSFYPSAIDWDESLYFLMAREFLRGKSLYLSVWDHKPPGLYILFAWSELVFGQGVLSPRIAACVFVALSGTLLYRFGRDVLASHAVGVVAALLYVAFSVSNVGLAANSELFFTPFVILGFYLLLIPGGLADGGTRLGWPRLLCAGLCLGCSLQVKYVTVFDLAGLLALVLFFGGRRHVAGPRPRAGSAIAWVSLGALLPFVPCLLYFWRAGHLADYIYANFTANAIHSRDASFSLVALLRLMAGQIKANLLPWCAVLVSPLFVATFRRSAPRSVRDLGLLGTWLSFGFLGVVFTRRINLHNFLQILPELCLIGAYVTVQSVSFGAARDRGRRMLLLLLILIPGAFRPLYDSARASLVPVWEESGGAQKDVPRLLAAYLKGRIDADSYLYVVDTDPILYHLAGARHPTRYIFPPFLLDEHYARVAGIDPLAELERIMRLRPRYVVMLDPGVPSRFHSALDEHLRRDYTKETVIEGVAIYSLAGGQGPAPS